MAGLRDRRGRAGYSWLLPYVREHAAEGSHHAGAVAAAIVRGFELARDAGITRERAALLASLLVGAVTSVMVMWPANRLMGYFFDWFNRAFTATANGYSRLVGGMLRRFGRVCWRTAACWP